MAPTDRSARCYIRQQIITMQEYSLCANIVWYVTPETRRDTGRPLMLIGVKLA